MFYIIFFLFFNAFSSETEINTFHENRAVSFVHKTFLENYNKEILTIVAVGAFCIIFDYNVLMVTGYLAVFYAFCKNEFSEISALIAMLSFVLSIAILGKVTL